MCKGLDMPKYTLHNSQLHSFTASQLHSFTASQLHSFTASQLHRGIAFFLHTYIIIFSHQRMHKEQNGFSMDLFYNRHR